MPKGISTNLDFLRSVAVLLVLTQHLCVRLHVDRIAWISIGTLGPFGVLIFFVHTSLVLMYSMERSSLKGRALLKDFYIRRVFRIYPLSILAIAAALVLHLNSDINGVPGLSHGPAPGKVSIIAQFLLMQNLIHVRSIVNVLWSLPYEVQMYIFLPFLFFWIRRSRAFWPLIALWIVSLAGAWSQPRFSVLYRFPLLNFVPCFLPGVIAFALPHLPRLKAFLWPVFVFGLIAVFTLIPASFVGMALCLILGLAIPFFQEIRTPAIRVASHRIATYSYGIYISHQFCIWFALGVLAARPVWLRFGALVILLIAIPVLLYHGIEKPMIQAGIRLAKYRGSEKTEEKAPLAAAA